MTVSTSPPQYCQIINNKNHHITLKQSIAVDLEYLLLIYIMTMGTECLMTDMNTTPGRSVMLTIKLTRASKHKYDNRPNEITIYN